MSVTASQPPLKVFIVCGEHSGDALGAGLMRALRERAPGTEFEGVGGEQMTAAGLVSLFPLDDIVVMGPIAILKAYPHLRRRAYDCIEAAVAADPDVLIIIDAPEFTHAVAKRVRRRRPELPVINYVSPSVWAWRPGRAKVMRRYVDHVLALLPFEPEAHDRLGGPDCTYVGHPLVEKRAWIAERDTDAFRVRLGIAPHVPILTVLPGSRGSEVARLMAPFGETVARLKALRGPERPFAIVVPAVPHREDVIREGLKTWSVPAHVVTSEGDKWSAFRASAAALAASGTVTLELAVAGTPMVVGYKVDALASRLRFLVKVPSIVLANLVLGRNAIPEFIQEDCEPDMLVAALAPLMDRASEARCAQIKALEDIEVRLSTGDETPSVRAAGVVLSLLAQKRSGRG